MKKVFLIITASFIAAILSLPLLGGALEEQKINGMTGGYPNSTTYNATFSQLDAFRFFLIGNAAEGWIIHSATVTNGTSWTVGFTSSSAAAAATAEGSNPKKAPELFSVTLSGEIYKPGPEPGNMGKFKIEAEHSGAFAITDGPGLIAYKDYVSKAYTAYVGTEDSPKLSNWTITPSQGGGTQTKDNVESISLGSMMFELVPLPGINTIEAKPASGENVSDTAILKVYYMHFSPSSVRMKWDAGWRYDVSLKEYLIAGNSYDVENVTWISHTNDASVIGGWVTFNKDYTDCGNIVIEAKSNDLGRCLDLFTFYPEQPPQNTLDIDIQGVNDEVEESPGGFVMFNDDDDNLDRNVDRKIKFDMLSGDDDLIKVSLKCLLDPDNPIEDAHPLKLQVPYSNLAIMRIWDNPDRNGDPIIANSGVIEYTSPSDVPSNIYVEASGAELGGTAPFQIKLKFYHPNCGSLEDTVVVRPAKVNINLEDLKNEKTIREDGEIVRVEPYEFTTGAFLQVNNFQYASFKELDIDVLSTGLPSSTELKLEWPGDKLKIFHIENDLADLLSSPYKIALSELPRKLYVYPEAPSETLRDIEIRASLVTPTNAVTCEDRIRVTNIGIDIDAEGVEEEKEDTPGENLLILVNNDDDDDNDVYDFNETDHASADNDLAKLPLSVDIPSDIENAEVRIKIASGARFVKLWKDAQKSELIADRDNKEKIWMLSVDEIPEHVYIEGIRETEDADNVKIKLSVLKDGNAIGSDSIIVEVMNPSLAPEKAYYIGSLHSESLKKDKSMVPNPQNDDLGVLTSYFKPITYEGRQIGALTLPHTIVFQHKPWTKDFFPSYPNPEAEAKESNVESLSAVG